MGPHTRSDSSQNVATSSGKFPVGDGFRRKVTHFNTLDIPLQSSRQRLCPLVISTYFLWTLLVGHGIADVPCAKVRFHM